LDLLETNSPAYPCINRKGKQAMNSKLRPGTAETYPITDRNRAKRLHERAKYDRKSVYAILDAGFLCHVAYVIDGQPFCTPTIHWRKGDWLYWHGSAASRMLRNQSKGAQVCVTVSHLDALVLARCGFNHSADYRSAMCFGTARLIDDPVQKAEALLEVVDRFYPDRTSLLRPSTEQEIKATSVVGMKIEEATAKVRTKGVGDEEEDLGLPIWAGIFPITTVIGAAKASTLLPAGTEMPESLKIYAEGRRLDDALLEAQAHYEAD
jgi:nitroimidazol reductase NimA-like FMN-containing flavoprotein (pyridoxamine 5'-phosphate oxidase superfamily)